MVCIDLIIYIYICVFTFTFFIRAYTCICKYRHDESPSFLALRVAFDCCLRKNMDLGTWPWWIQNVHRLLQGSRDTFPLVYHQACQPRLFAKQNPVSQTFLFWKESRRCGFIWMMGYKKMNERKLEDLRESSLWHRFCRWRAERREFLPLQDCHGPTQPGFQNMWRVCTSGAGNYPLKAWYSLNGLKRRLCVALFQRETICDGFLMGFCDFASWGACKTTAYWRCMKWAKSVRPCPPRKGNQRSWCCAGANVWSF